MTDREKFEAWIAEADIGSPECGRDGECYVDWDTQVAWRGWKAARTAALEEAAKVCDEKQEWYEKDRCIGQATAVGACAEEIRDLEDQTT